MSDEEIEVARDPRATAGHILNKLERAYLSAIRAIALLAATLLVGYAAWLASSGAYKSSRDAASVQEAPAAVSAEEVTKIDPQKLKSSESRRSTDPWAAQKAYYADFTKRYFAVFRAKFEPFRQAEDKRLDQKAFDGRFMRIADRVDGVQGGTVNFDQDKADLESWLVTVSAASVSKPALDRLRAYKAAKKQRLTRTINDTREERYCSYYGFYIDQCITYDTRTVPFKRTVTEMRLPEGVISHIDLLAAYQDRYFSMLNDRRNANSAVAERQRSEILADNQDGSARLWTALQLVGGFVVLMLLFLLIALERHQRRIAASSPAGEGGGG
jgi:hypothetical protein